MRINELFNLDVLEAKTVIVIGLGSIGSEGVKELAASGVGNFILIDPEHFEAGNSVRHAGDLQNIGELKVDIARKLIQARNPRAKVTSVAMPLFNLPLKEIIASSQVDVILDFTANRLVEEYLYDNLYQKLNIPFIQAAVSKGALTGIVLVFNPSVSACLKCLRKRKQNHVPASLVATDVLEATVPDYGACSQPALPGSGIDTREVALQAARVTLQFLLKGESTFYPKLPGYQFYWHGPAGSKSGRKKKEKYEWEICNFMPESSCETCNPKI